jgi:Uma2 family endonuclease
MSVAIQESSLLTWDEYLNLPYETRNTDLIDGRLVMNSPTAQHERILRRLLIDLDRWLEHAGRLGEATTQQPVKITNRRGYQPDMSWFPVEQCAAADSPADFVGLPAIVVEVLSPSTRAFDLVRKRHDYDELGIAEFWIVDPVSQSMLVMRRPTPGAPFDDIEVSKDQALTSPELPGFTVAVSSLFRA